MVGILFHVRKRCSEKPIVLLIFDEHVHGYVVLIRALIDACLEIGPRPAMSGDDRLAKVSFASSGGCYLTSFLTAQLLDELSFQYQLLGARVS
jgi:hypothetical protein